MEFAPDGRDNSVFTEDQKEKWVKDSDSFLKYRKEIEGTMNRFFDTLYKNSPLQAAAVEQYTEMMKIRLKGREELTTKLIPQFAVGCRRYVICPPQLELKTS
jgi:hypothetical protein